MGLRSAARVLTIVLLAGAAACGIDAIGSMPSSSTPLPDAGGGTETGAAEAGPCRSITTNSPGSLVAPKAASPLNVDGDLSDWDACFIPLDRTNAYSVRDIAGAGVYPSGEFSVMHDGAKIYVAVRLQKVGDPGSAEGDSLFMNDSAEIYFDADGMLAQTYGADTTQIVVDHAGRRQGYRMSAAVGTPGSRAAARNGADGTTVTLELEVSPETFGQTSFAPSLGFDVAFNNGDGNAQLTQIIWFQQCRKSSGCGCADGNDAPYCDGRQFGSLMLAP